MEKLTGNEFPIHDLLRKRWSPRAFADRPVEAAKLRSLFEAARWAPSSYNEQPWAFLVATRDQPAEYARLLGCLVAFNQSWAKSAPVLIVTAAHTTFERNGKENRHAYHDVGLAMACLTVQATAEGLYVHQMAGIDVEKARKDLSIPSGWDPVTGAALGYLGDPASLPAELRERELAPGERKPLSNVAFSSSFGKAAPFLS